MLSYIHVSKFPRQIKSEVIGILCVVGSFFSALNKAYVIMHGGLPASLAQTIFLRTLQQYLLLGRWLIILVSEQHTAGFMIHRPCMNLLI